MLGSYYGKDFDKKYPKMAIFGSFLGAVSEGPLIGPRNSKKCISYTFLYRIDFFWTPSMIFFFDKLAPILHVMALFFFFLHIKGPPGALAPTLDAGDPPLYGP